MVKVPVHQTSQSNRKKNIFDVEIFDFFFFWFSLRIEYGFKIDVRSKKFPCINFSYLNFDGFHTAKQRSDILRKAQ